MCDILQPGWNFDPRSWLIGIEWDFTEVYFSFGPLIYVKRRQVMLELLD